MNDKKLSFPDAVKIFGKALKVSLRARGAASLVLSMIGFAVAFLPMLISLAVRRFSDAVQQLYGQGEAAVVSVLGIFIILSALHIIQLIWGSLSSYFEQRDHYKIQMFMEERVLRCSCDVKYKYIENYDDFKQRISFVETEAGNRVAESVGTTIRWLQSIITFISIVTVLWSVDVWIVVIMVATCIPAIIITAKFSESEYKNKGFWILEYLMACAYFFEATMQQSLNDVRFFGAYPWLKSKFDRKNAEYIQIKNRVTKKHVLFNAIADIFRSCVYIFILLIAARKIFDDSAVGIGAFMLVFTMASQLQDVTARIFTEAAQFVSNAAYMRDFFSLDELEYEQRDPKAEGWERFDLDFDHVSFTYPNTEREVIHDLTLHIREGEKIAIVGENGSGKTTFISLLCALYEPDRGTVTMGGESIYTDVSRTRRTLSAAFQDFARYETSIRENIVVSDRRRMPEDAEVEAVARRNGAWEFISAQPHGMDEVVGSFSETGNNLSGGQWQKLALCRCAWRQDAKIMILDEPTAALDPLAEAELYRNFTGLTGDRTTILISHRLGITQLVDRILVFDAGGIVEDGSHEELLKKQGLYTRMFQAQAQWYL